MSPEPPDAAVTRVPRPKVAVIGTGSLGKEHARIYADLAAAGTLEFAGVHDTDLETAKRVAAKCSVPVFKSLAETVAASDALSVVTPTHTHFAIARELLRQGKHVLLEKPMTQTAAEAAELIQLARESSSQLMVGHVERFNPIYRYLEAVATQPWFIEVHRLSPYPSRSTDIGVVLDLMIHDLDVILAFVKSPVVHLDAVGVAVLSPSEDIANARLRFASGCVANLTASRISPERMRRIRVFSGGSDPCYVSLDYRAQQGYVYRMARDDQPASSFFRKLLQGKEASIVSEFGGKRIVREPIPLERGEPLRLELEHFVASVQALQTPLVSGESAKRSLELALEITRQIERTAQELGAGSRLGPDGRTA